MSVARLCVSDHRLCPTPLQIEGVIADYGIGLGDLIGVITEFFSRVGEL